MECKEPTPIQSIYVTVHGPDLKPEELHLDKNTTRSNGEHLYYDNDKNVLLLKGQDGNLHMQLILAKPR